MAHFELKIEIDNDAFMNNGSYEISRILKEVAEEKLVGDIDNSANLYDINGNKVGGYEFVK